MPKRNGCPLCSWGPNLSNRIGRFVTQTFSQGLLSRPHLSYQHLPLNKLKLKKWCKRSTWRDHWTTHLSKRSSTKKNLSLRYSLVPFISSWCQFALQKNLVYDFSSSKVNASCLASRNWVSSHISPKPRVQQACDSQGSRVITTSYTAKQSPRYSDLFA